MIKFWTENAWQGAASRSAFELGVNAVPMADSPSAIGANVLGPPLVALPLTARVSWCRKSSVGPGSLALLRARRPPASYADDRCVLLLPVQRLCSDTVCLANKECEKIAAIQRSMSPAASQCTLPHSKHRLRGDVPPDVSQQLARWCSGDVVDLRQKPRGL